MRYSLRNKYKIEKALGKKECASILQSLDVYFTTTVTITQQSAKPYNIISVKNQTKTGKQYKFHVISTTYDVMLLAYKPECIEESDKENQLPI